jgi:hypothetical protein
MPGYWVIWGMMRIFGNFLRHFSYFLVVLEMVIFNLYLKRYLGKIEILVFLAIRINPWK